MLRVSEGTKELWVAAAHDERVSLSEWIRRRCDGALVAGDGEAVVPIGAQPGAVSRDLRPSPATSARSFRADPKNGGLGSGEVLAQSPPVVAAAVSPEPSPLAAGGRTEKSGSIGTVESPGRPTSASPAASGCPADTPKGVRCKLCGKKH